MIYDKKKDVSRGTSGSTVPSVSNDTPFFNDSISDNSEFVNRKFSYEDTVTDEKDGQYSFEEERITPANIDELRSIGRKSVNEFTDEDIKKAEPFARRALKELGVKSPFFRAWFGDWRANDNKEFAKTDIAEGDTRGIARNSDTGWDIMVSRQVHKETTHHSSSKTTTAVKYLPYIKSITENAVLFDSYISDNNNSLSVMYHKLYAYTEELGYPALLKLTVEELADEKTGSPIRRDYILHNIEEESLSKRNRLSTPNHNESNSSAISIADLFNLVKTYDKEFNPKPASVVVDEDGNPLVMYHGTNADENFTVFDTYGGSFGLFGIGSYFTDSKEIAQSYTKKGKGNNPRVYEVYLNIKNPLDMDAKAEKPKWIEAVDEQDRADFERYIEGAETNEDVFKGLKELCADNEMYREEAYEYITNVIQKMGYDGITHIGGGRYGKDDGTRHRVYITFESEQVKSATDNVGTFNENNPDIIFSVSKVEEKDKYSYIDLKASDYYTDSHIYSYDFLVSQNDMTGVELPKTGVLTNDKGKIDDSKVLSMGIKNALSVGTKRGEKIYVQNSYTKRELRIDNSTIKHGLDGTYNRHLTNARIGSVIGEVVKNAIPINALNNTSEKAVGTYAMVSYCYDDLNREFIAVVTVEQHSDNVQGVEIYDVSHAVSGRQKKSSQVDTKSQGVNPIKAATISISDLLEVVNSTHQSILSENVLYALGEQRNPKGSYSDKVLFSVSNPTIPKGESPARDVDVPAYDDKGGKVSEHIRTIAEARGITAKLKNSDIKLKGAAMQLLNLLYVVFR